MTPSRHGIFITFEGLDGCGKSTQLERLAHALRARGLEVVCTREPGGTALGERIRALLLDSRTHGLSTSAELALMFAARAQHIHEIITPALRAGKHVLCDRFTDSSEAYQGGGRELGRAVVAALEQSVCGGVRPDLTILMDSDPPASLARARRRNDSRLAKNLPAGSEGRFERENLQFFERVHQAYLAIARREPKRVIVVNARRSIAEVHSYILAAVESRLHLRELRPAPGAARKIHA